MKIYLNPTARCLRKNAYLLHIASIVLLALLCGCSSLHYFRGSAFNSAKYESECEKPGICEEEARLCMARQFARDRATEYRSEYTSLKIENTWLFDIPLIGLAAAVTGNLLFGNIVDLTKGLGLAAATLTGFRTYANDTQRAGFFLLAEEAAQCVVEKSAAFINAQKDHNSIEQNAKKISDKGQLLDQAQALLPKLGDGKEKEALQSAIALGISSIELASGALRAIDDSSNKVVDSIYVIDRKLTSLIEKNSPDINAIIAKIQSAAQTSADSQKASDTIKDESKNVATGTKGLLQVPLAKETDPQKALRLAQEIKNAGDVINARALIYTKADSDLSVCSAKL